MAFGEGISSVDGKGHGNTTKVQIPPALLQAAAEVAASKDWPIYRRVNDVIRDGLYRLMVELAAVTPEIDEAWQLALVEQAQLKRSQRQELLNGIVERFGQQFSFAKDAEEVKEIMEELHSVLDMGLPDGIRWELERLQRGWSGG